MLKFIIWSVVLGVVTLVLFDLFLWKKGAELLEHPITQDTILELFNPKDKNAEEKSPMDESPVVEQSVEVERVVAPQAQQEVEVETSQMEAPEEPLPPLTKSDKPIQQALGEIVDQKRYKNVLNLRTVIQRFVVTINNVTGRKLSSKYSLTRAPRGKFVAKEDVLGGEYLDPKNFKRYSKYIRLMEALDTDKLAVIYLRYYPLFQEAYEDLGYSGKSFHDRLMYSIDHLLKTPHVKGRIALRRPSVFYKFVDRDLEARSAGQKILIRIGKDNTDRLKVKLRELKKSLKAIVDQISAG